jgi:hypothetical protein
MAAFQAMSLIIGCKAERELERPAPEEGESADQIYRRA